MYKIPLTYSEYQRFFVSCVQDLYVVHVNLCGYREELLTCCDRCRHLPTIPPCLVASNDVLEELLPPCLLCWVLLFMAAATVLGAVPLSIESIAHFGSSIHPGLVCPITNFAAENFTEYHAVS